MGNPVIAQAIVVDAPAGASVTKGYRILDGAYTGCRFAAPRDVRTHLGAVVTVKFYPDDQFAHEVDVRERVCTIDSASLEDIEGRGDGAYSLLDVEGSPDEVGKQIADTLKDCDLSNTPREGLLFLNVRIKIRRVAHD